MSFKIPWSRPLPWGLYGILSHIGPFHQLWKHTGRCKGEVRAGLSSSTQISSTRRGHSECRGPETYQKEPTQRPQRPKPLPPCFHSAGWNVPEPEGYQDFTFYFSQLQQPFAPWALVLALAFLWLTSLTACLRMLLLLLLCCSVRLQDASYFFIQPTARHCSLLSSHTSNIQHSLIPVPCLLSSFLSSLALSFFF